GPIWRAVYFKDDIQGDRLFWVIHHLAVDGVSWRILMEDLKNAYLQLQEGGEITLPPKTSSYKDWAYNLKEYAYSSYIQDAKHYWLTEYSEITPVIPVDFPNGRNEEKYTDQVTVTFTEKETQELLKEMNKTYRVNVDEVLLTALVLSVTDWMGENQIAVNLEGHGREEIVQD